MKVCKSGIWISIDGTDGTGKTAVAHHLQGVLEGSVLAPEFSDSANGSYLRETVQSKPHYISESLIEQSLLFLADFFRIYDCVVLPSIREGLVVISDRGFVSKYVYQYIVLSSVYDRLAIMKALDSLFCLIAPPNLTLFLTCEEKAQRERLLDRDGHCSEDRMEFIRRANAEYVKCLVTCKCDFVRIDQDRYTPVDTLLAKSEQIVEAFLLKSRLR